MGVKLELLGGNTLYTDIVDLPSIVYMGVSARCFNMDDSRSLSMYLTVPWCSWPGFTFNSPASLGSVKPGKNHRFNVDNFGYRPRPPSATQNTIQFKLEGWYGGAMIYSDTQDILLKFIKSDDGSWSEDYHDTFTDVQKSLSFNSGAGEPFPDRIYIDNTSAFSPGEVVTINDDNTPSGESKTIIGILLNTYLEVDSALANNYTVVANGKVGKGTLDGWAQRFGNSISTSVAHALADMFTLRGYVSNNIHYTYFGVQLYKSFTIGAVSEAYAIADLYLTASGSTCMALGMEAVALGRVVGQYPMGDDTGFFPVTGQWIRLVTPLPVDQTVEVSIYPQWAIGGSGGNGGIYMDDFRIISK